MDAIDAVDAASFRAALRDAVRVDDGRPPRLCRLLQPSRGNLRGLRRFAQWIHAGACQFTGVLANLVASAPDEAARSLLLQNLMAEEGLVLVPGRGLVRMEVLRHSNWSARFVAACGATGGDHVASKQASFMDPDRIARTRDPQAWQVSVAYFLLGGEGSFSQACNEFLVALRRHGLADDALEFFVRHAVDDEKHGSDALDLLCERAVTATQQAAALEAARAGAAVWYPSPARALMARGSSSQPA